MEILGATVLEQISNLFVLVAYIFLVLICLSVSFRTKLSSFWNKLKEYISHPFS